MLQASDHKLNDGDYSEIDADDINEQLIIQEVNATASGANPIIVKFNDSEREYEIDSNGDVEQRPAEETGD